MEVKKATYLDAQELTELTIRSKAYWGYSKTQIEAWREELTITESYIAKNEVYKIGNAAIIMGFYTYHPLSSTEVKLDFLFIAPEHIGKGLGQILIHDFLNRAAQDGFKNASLDADPNAEDFYKKQGFTVVGQLQSSIKNRFLPIMHKEIKATQDTLKS